MPRTKKVVQTMPKGSVLAEVVRKGREGNCIACGKTVSAHMKRGTWIGCQADNVPDSATFVLVPTTFPAKLGVSRVIGTSNDQPRSKAVWDGQERRADNLRAKPTEQRRAIAYAGPRYLYMATDKRKKHIEATPAFQDTYNALLKAKGPVTPVEAAKLADAPVEANRVRLNQLVMAGLVTKIEKDNE